MKDKINKHTFFKLVGLLTLAEHNYKKLREIEKSIAYLLDEKDNGDNYYGHISDMVWGQESWNAVELLKKMEIGLDKKELDDYYDGEHLKTFVSEDEIKEKMQAQKDL